MAANLEKIVDDLSGLTVIEAAELSKMLEEKWGVSAAAPVAVAVAADSGAGAEIEQTEFDVILASFGEKKINVIKEAVGKDEAAELKTKLESAGATVEVN